MNQLRKCIRNQILESCKLPDSDYERGKLDTLFMILVELDKRENLFNRKTDRLIFDMILTNLNN
jgi:hypothetical protein